MDDIPLRTHEIVMLKRKHLILDTGKEELIVPKETKTGTRSIPLRASIIPLKNYLETIKSLNPEDALFLHETWNDEKRPMTDEALRTMLKKVAKRAKITKSIYPYVFRHGTITRLANSLTNAQIEKIAGWEYGSPMHAVYQSLDNADVRKALEKSDGIVRSETNVQKENTMRTCSRCQFEGNNSAALFCGRCSAALDLSVAMKVQEEDEKLRDAISDSLSDPNVVKMLMPVLKGIMKEKAKK